MKLKALTMCLAATAILASCSAPAPSSSSSPASSTQSSASSASAIHYLNFLQDKELRVDIFDIEEGIQFSYGNAALDKAVNTLTLSDNSHFSVNKAAAHEKSFNAIFVAEKNNTEDVHKKCYLGAEGDNLLDWIDLLKNEVVGYDRAYVALSEGEHAKWTKGLNAEMDPIIEAMIGEN